MCFTFFHECNYNCLLTSGAGGSLEFVGTRAFESTSVRIRLTRSSVLAMSRRRTDIN